MCARNSTVQKKIAIGTTKTEIFHLGRREDEEDGGQLDLWEDYSIAKGATRVVEMTAGRSSWD